MEDKIIITVTQELLDEWTDIYIYEETSKN